MDNDIHTSVYGEKLFPYSDPFYRDSCCVKENIRELYPVSEIWHDKFYAYVVLECSVCGKKYHKKKSYYEEDNFDTKEPYEGDS